MPDTDDLALARWEVATLTGRLRCVEAERDAAVRDRDRTRDLVRALRRSPSYRIGRVLVDLATDPVRNGPTIAGRAARRLRRRRFFAALRRGEAPSRGLRAVFRRGEASPRGLPSVFRRGEASSRGLPSVFRRGEAQARAVRRKPPAAAVPARVYVAVGLSRPASKDLVRALRQRILVDADHLPVVVTDQPSLCGLQVAGVVLEYLPDPQTWARHYPGSGWESLLAGRIAQLCRDYRAAGALVVDPRDPPTLARLLEPVTPR